VRFLILFLTVFITPASALTGPNIPLDNLTYSDPSLNPPNISEKPSVDVSPYMKWGIRTYDRSRAGSKAQWDKRDFSKNAYPPNSNYVEVTIEIDNKGTMPITSDPANWVLKASDGTIYQYDSRLQGIESGNSLSMPWDEYKHRIEPGKKETFRVHYYITTNVNNIVSLGYSNPFYK
jgi:hypothetical protein